MSIEQPWENTVSDQIVIPSSSDPARGPVTFTRYQKIVVGILAFLQFTVILDFVILSPLGAMLMPALNLTASQFSLVVSGYAFSAGISGLLASGFADRFDRKKLLLFFYSGFLLGTFLCGIAPNFWFLLMARIITGCFGGVIASIVFAIATDLFPPHMRGRVMGIVQTAFAASQVFGMPIGLYLATHFGWHIPFVMIVCLGAGAGLVILYQLNPVDEHLKTPRPQNAWLHFWHTVANARHIHGFASTALLSTGGFMLMPFSSAFAVNNVKIDLEHLPLVYLITGIASIIGGPLIGKLSDTIGKFPVFAVGSLLTIAMVFVYTNLEATPIAVFIGINIVLFVGITSRMISSQALLSELPDPAHRGSFMAINSSFQQISGGLASVIAGAVVVKTDTGHIEHFDYLGLAVIGTTVLSLFLMYTIHRRLKV